MPFTREFIRSVAKESGVEIPKELEDALVQEHISTRDVFSAEKVKAALEENKPEPAPKVKDTQEYKDLKKEFEDYKAGVTAKETKAAKESAARAYYESRGIIGKSLEIAMRSSSAEIEALELADGKIKDTKDLDGLIAGTLAPLASTAETHGASTSNPPAVSPGKMGMDEIYKKDDKGRYVYSASERQRALAENLAQNE